MKDSGVFTLLRTNMDFALFLGHDIFMSERHYGKSKNQMEKYSCQACPELVTYRAYKN
jgi:hypothetical protein